MIARHSAKSSRQASACFGAFSAVLVFLILSLNLVEISYPDGSARKSSSASGLRTATPQAAGVQPGIPLTQVERLEHATSRRNGDPSTLPSDLNLSCGTRAGPEVVSGKFVYSNRCGLWDRRSRLFVVGTNLRLSDLASKGASTAEASRSIRQLLLLHRQHGLNVVRLILDCVTIRGAPDATLASATVPELLGCDSSSLVLLDTVLAAATRIDIKVMVALMDWPGVLRQLARHYEQPALPDTPSTGGSRLEMTPTAVAPAYARAAASFLSRGSLREGYRRHVQAVVRRCPRMVEPSGRAAAATPATGAAAAAVPCYNEDPVLAAWELADALELPLPGGVRVVAGTRKILGLGLSPVGGGAAGGGDSFDAADDGDGYAGEDGKDGKGDGDRDSNQYYGRDERYRYGEEDEQLDGLGSGASIAATTSLQALARGWVSEMAAFVKRMDTNHLLATGETGWQPGWPAGWHPYGGRGEGGGSAGAGEASGGLDGGKGDEASSNMSTGGSAWGVAGSGHERTMFEAGMPAGHADVADVGIRSDQRPAVALVDLYAANLADENIDFGTVQAVFGGRIRRGGDLPRRAAATGVAGITGTRGNSVLPGGWDSDEEPHAGEVGPPVPTAPTGFANFEADFIAGRSAVAHNAGKPVLMVRYGARIGTLCDKCGRLVTADSMGAAVSWPPYEPPVLPSPWPSSSSVIPSSLPMSSWSSSLPGQPTVDRRLAGPSDGIGSPTHKVSDAGVAAKYRGDAGGMALEEGSDRQGYGAGGQGQGVSKGASYSGDARDPGAAPHELSPSGSPSGGQMGAATGGGAGENHENRGAMREVLEDGTRVLALSRDKDADGGQGNATGGCVGGPGIKRLRGGASPPLSDTGTAAGGCAHDAAAASITSTPNGRSDVMTPKPPTSPSAPLVDPAQQSTVQPGWVGSPGVAAGSSTQGGAKPDPWEGLYCDVLGGNERYVMLHALQSAANTHLFAGMVVMSLVDHDNDDDRGDARAAMEAAAAAAAAAAATVTTATATTIGTAVGTTTVGSSVATNTHPRGGVAGLPSQPGGLTGLATRASHVSEATSSGMQPSGSLKGDAATGRVCGAGPLRRPDPLHHGYLPHVGYGCRDLWPSDRCVAGPMDLVAGWMHESGRLQQGVLDGQGTCPWDERRYFQFGYGSDGGMALLSQARYYLLGSSPHLMPGIRGWV